ncbi:MAG TPA: acetyl-CoA carboxylase biotin carboxyl carrier protein [Planctomycetaceae bacterium]|jgi:acetyl-CoA carboxylase biotin carboxyl carrier protein|nr:acetyl-CoA carboxylase biotin carboxyl carrier protein [Pirellulales bacterium]HCK73165.1 acetyl-CoA carboxylase biotin carboxyl carrier protein [Planctomycetaceae bacterium]HCP84723.1 acetyl-CoA carboxylase biotin carboxyl carrier protein [Planctomycetaceae bacterium]|tara:strand:- start:6421 stop:6894 length:474 start_codon:yes stop_codon:yes gene_type:complete
MAAKDKTPDVFAMDRILELIDLMKEHDLCEIDLKQDDEQIRLVRGGQPVIPVAAAPAPAAPAAAPAATDSAPAADDNLITINSPMVGTFYSRPNPDSDSFVQIGDIVNNDTTVCIIEAMKVFNEIQAEVKGKIVAILVDDEEPVDVGKPLFKVDPSM